MLSQKGYLRGFDTIDISFNCLKQKELKHNQKYSIFYWIQKNRGESLTF